VLFMTRNRPIVPYAPSLTVCVLLDVWGVGLKAVFQRTMPVQNIQVSLDVLS
jgi:hypothetical protein